MIRSRLAIGALVAGLALLGLSGAPLAAQTCPASASWFTNPSFPTEVAGGTNANNCAFHQLAWQAFAAATQPQGGPLTFETWMPDYGIFVTSGSPVPWGQSPPTPCKNDAANATGRVFRLRTAKSATTAVNPNGDDQAFGGALYDQNSQAVWYETYVNEAEYDFITGCQFYNTGCIQAAPSTTALPSGSVEIKTSWRLWPSSSTPPAGYYAVQGFLDNGSCTPATFLLVGIHVVINTPLHPEFIWATFEHVDNDPDCTSPQSAPPGGWSFNNPNCTQGGQPCPTNIQNTNPTQVCRVNPWGGGSTQNTQNIPALNQSVQSVLASLIQQNPAQYGYLKTWQSYEMTGNLWTVNGALPPSSSNFAGSIYNANTTLETYAQNANGFQNCFTCHSNLSTGKFADFPGNAPANFSHLFKEAAESGGCNNGAGPLPAACTAGASAAKRKAALLDPYRVEPAAPAGQVAPLASHTPSGRH